MLKDSGSRREFESGAVRDMAQGKGRCDLMPLDVCSSLFIGVDSDICVILDSIDRFKETGDFVHLEDAIKNFWALFKYEEQVDAFGSSAICDMLLQVAVHFEEGAKKYGENNWQKGLPASCYIDSAIRHYLKFLRGDTDEPHDRAFVWNLMCCIWTCKHKPELNSYKKPEVTEDDTSR